MKLGCFNLLSNGGKPHLSLSLPQLCYIAVCRSGSYCEEAVMRAWKPMKDISRVLRVARQLSRAVSCPLVLSMPSTALQHRLCRKLLWSSGNTRAHGSNLKSETQLAQEGKVLFLYLIFSALE